MKKMLTITAGLALLAALMQTVTAATYTWDGETDDYWSTDANWSPDGAPPAPGDGTDDLIIREDSGPAIATQTYHVASLQLGRVSGGGALDARFPAGADVTCNSVTFPDRTTLRVYDGGRFAVASSFGAFGYGSSFRINDAADGGDGTGRLSTINDLGSGQSLSIIDGADTNTLVLQVHGAFNYARTLNILGGKTTVGSYFYANKGTITMSGGLLDIGADFRGGAAASFTATGATVRVGGNVLLRYTGDGGSTGPYPMIIGNGGRLELTGSGHLLVGASTQSSRTGEGVLRIQDGGLLVAPASDLRIGGAAPYNNEADYADGTYVQSGASTATVSDVWVGYHTDPDASGYGYGTFIMNNGVLNCDNFNIRGGVSATVSNVGGTIAVSGGTFNILSLDETAKIELSGATYAFDGATAKLEAPSWDQGAVEAGWSANYALGTLHVAAGATLTLQDVNNNTTADGGAAEAVYVDSLVMGDNSTLDLNDLNLYYRPGALITGSGVTFSNGIPSTILPAGTVITIR